MSIGISKKILEAGLTTERPPQKTPSEDRRERHLHSCVTDAAGEKRPEPMPHITCTDFPKRAAGRHDPMPPPVTVCTDLQRRGEVTPPYGSDPENPCMPRERPGEGTRPYGYAQQNRKTNIFLICTICRALLCAERRAKPAPNGGSTPNIVTRS